MLGLYDSLDNRDELQETDPIDEVVTQACQGLAIRQSFHASIAFGYYKSLPGLRCLNNALFFGFMLFMHRR